MSAPTISGGLPPDLIEVRLFGAMRVRRADGSLVDPREWRTRKNQDLLRILALEAGRRVPVDVLVEALWRDAGSDRGRASLRTAASHIRRVLRSESIERVHDGLVLRGVWVDALAFASLARECQIAMAGNRFADAVAAARQADALYVGDLEVPSGDCADLFVAEREALIQTHATLMDNAAAAAAALHWMRDAVEFAERAIAARPNSERAYRSAMLGYAGLGEIQRGLSVYELRTTQLANQLGIDPPAQTQAVHLQLLRMGPPREVEAPLVGRDAELERLRSRVTELMSAGGGCIVVAGASRTGTARLLDEVVARLDCDVLRPRTPADISPESVAGQIVVLDHIEGLPVGSLRDVLDTVSAARPAPVVLAPHRTGVRDAADDELERLVEEGAVERLELGPLAPGDVKTLTEHLISGPPTEELLEAVQQETGGHAGLVVDLIRTWLLSGRLIHTGRGLDLGPEASLIADPTAADGSLARVRERLAPEDHAVLEVVAAVGAGVSVSGVHAVLCSPADFCDDAAAVGPDAAEVARVLSLLEDLGLLTTDSAGRYAVRNPVLRDAVRAWMRPAARRQLHRRVAECMTLTVGARVRQWLEAGEPQLACAAAIDGAVQAMAECDFAEARRLLHKVQELLDPETARPEDKLEVLARLVLCCDQLGLESDAEQSRSAGRALAEAHGLPWPTELVEERRLAPVTVLHTGQQPLLERLGITASTSPTTEVESLLTDALGYAQRHGDTNDESEARLLLAGLVLLPRRRFSDARRVLRDALAPGTAEHDALRLLVSHEVDVLLGGPSIDLLALERARQQSARVTGLVSGLPAAVLSALARHHRHDPDADSARTTAAAEAERLNLEGPWRWTVARLLIDHGDVDRAAAITSGATWREGGPTAKILALLGKAELARAEGDTESASISLLRGVEIALRTGASLLLPEVASRLVLVAEDADHESSVEYLDIAEGALGEVATGRERVMIMLARAKLRAADGRAVSAAELAGQAEALATSLDLVYSAREAATHRAAYLDVVHGPPRGRAGHHGASAPPPDRERSQRMSLAVPS